MGAFMGDDLYVAAREGDFSIEIPARKHLCKLDTSMPMGWYSNTGRDFQ